MHDHVRLGRGHRLTDGHRIQPIHHHAIGSEPAAVELLFVTSVKPPGAAGHPFGREPRARFAGKSQPLPPRPCRPLPAAQGCGR